MLIPFEIWHGSAHLAVHLILVRIVISLIIFVIIRRLAVEALSLPPNLLHLPFTKQLCIFDELIAQVRALVSKDECVAMHALLAHYGANL